MRRRVVRCTVGAVMKVMNIGIKRKKRWAEAGMMGIRNQSNPMHLRGRSQTTFTEPFCLPFVASKRAQQQLHEHGSWQQMQLFSPQKSGVRRYQPKMSMLSWRVRAAGEGCLVRGD